MSELAILFADVCGSTKMYEKFGNERARKIMSHCTDLMTAASTAHGGTLIKTIGDEVMCRFPSADQAAAGALDMQERVSNASVTGIGAPLSIHVGFHYGPVVEEEGDIFGDAVNVAARMVNLAKADQVLTTRATVELLSEKWRKASRQIDRAAVRGKSEMIDVFELVWQEAESTRVAGRVWDIPVRAPSGHLLVTQGAHEFEISEEHPQITVGRGAQNDLVMHGDLVSRLHARIEYRNGKYSLTDQSTNGTYVGDAAGKSTLVRHDSQVLTGAGVIALGHQPLPGQADLIRYKIAA
jgi:class 3 adenylate cyclase